MPLRSSPSIRRAGQAGAAGPRAPDWAYPGTATRSQVPPPPDFRRASTHYPIPLAIFEGQSDVGTAVVPGSARPMRGAPVTDIEFRVGSCGGRPGGSTADTLETAVISNVVLENVAGRVR